ncbi:hypothetical protein [Aquabacterium sp.]|uniref:hypothetical protein n=1 Tax=Aquabacterium sp. TaxID=1872578 RepID=UPI00262FBDE2|nr:hypothetical protein [Aquabacterium sp.]MDD2976829.1 hypothetical protein [Aquabacterium sp.]
MSLGSQATSQKFPFPYEPVFLGVLGAVQSLGMTVQSVDKVIGRITASSGMSLFSWGENLTFVVERVDDNTAVVSIESALKLGINIAGAHRHQKHFNEVISSVSQFLQRHAAAGTLPSFAPQTEKS